MTGFSEDPAVPYRAKLDKASFFSWVQRQEKGRFELKDGAIVLPAGSRERYARISYRSGFALGVLLDRPNVRVWQREEDTRAFPKLPAEVAGRDAKIEIPSLGIKLSLADLYRGIAEPKSR